jgi:hypothetical protein
LRLLHRHFLPKINRIINLEISMVVRDEHVRFLVLSHLIENAVRNQDCVQECGVEASELEALGNLPLSDLARLAALPEPRISIWLDGKQLAHGFRLLSHLKNQSQLIAYFIKNGATTAMLSSLFRITSAEVATRRSALSVEPARKKPALPPVAAREEIQNSWHHIRNKHKDVKPAPSDYFELHQAFPNYSLASLNASVHEFD